MMLTEKERKFLEDIVANDGRAKDCADCTTCPLVTLVGRRMDCGCAMSRAKARAENILKQYYKYVDELFEKEVLGG